MKRKEFRNILFLDIETTSAKASFDELCLKEQELWRKKSIKFSSNRMPLSGKSLVDSYTSKAAIFAEFAKVICITVAYISKEKKKKEHLRLKSFFGHDESQVLLAFCSLLDQHYFDASKYFLAGHNIKEFDIPFLARRMLVNKISLPKLFQIRGKKPWQVNYLIDTLDLWKFGDYKNYTSLNLLAFALGIESPKSDMDGSLVSGVYHREKDLTRIAKYCEKDVQTTVQILLKMYGLNPILNQNMESLTDWEVATT